MDLNQRPSGYEPDELPTAPPRNIIKLIKLVERAGLEPAKASPADLQSAPFGQLGNLSTLYAASFEVSNRYYSTFAKHRQENQNVKFYTLKTRVYAIPKGNKIVFLACFPEKSPLRGATI